MKKLSLFVIVSSLLLTGCKKDDSSGGGGGNCTLSSSTLPGVYLVTGETYQADAQSTPENSFLDYEACEKDDLLTIKTDGTATITEGATSCTPPSDPITINWSLSGSTFNIIFDGGFSISTTISNFNCNSFKVKYVDPDDQSITITTYTRK